MYDIKLGKIIRKELELNNECKTVFCDYTLDCVINDLFSFDLSVSYSDSEDLYKEVTINGMIEQDLYIPKEVDYDSFKIKPFIKKVFDILNDNFDSIYDELNKRQLDPENYTMEKEGDNLIYKKIIGG